MVWRRVRKGEAVGGGEGREGDVEGGTEGWKRSVKGRKMRSARREKRWRARKGESAREGGREGQLRRAPRRRRFSLLRKRSCSPLNFLQSPLPPHPLPPSPTSLSTPSTTPVPLSPLIPQTLLSLTLSVLGSVTPLGAVAGNEAADSERYSFGIELAEEDVEEEEELDEDVEEVEAEREEREEG